MAMQGKCTQCDIHYWFVDKSLQRKKVNEVECPKCKGTLQRTSQLSLKPTIYLYETGEALTAPKGS
jgi:NAD-dependent SIR2 family protein deacetylase